MQTQNNNQIQSVNKLQLGEYLKDTNANYTPAPVTERTASVHFFDKEKKMDNAKKIATATNSDLCPHCIHKKHQ